MALSCLWRPTNEFSGCVLADSDLELLSLSVCKPQSYYHTPFQDMFPSPNIQNRNMEQSWDRKQAALNREVAMVSRQMSEMKTTLSYIIQKLNANESAQKNSNPPVPEPKSQSIAQTIPTLATIQVPGTVSVPTSAAASLEQPVTSVSTSQIDKNFADLPTHCRIPAEDLLRLQRDSKSIGNFAAYLTIKLFPELFTAENQRYQYNYNGVGKEPLESKRRGYIYLQRYLLYFYPHLSDPKAYHNSVVDNVNEILRRKKLKTRVF